MKKARFRLIILALTLVVLFFLSFRYYGEWLWFENLDYKKVFETMLWTRLIVFAVFFFLFLIMALVNIAIARRIGNYTRAIYEPGKFDPLKMLNISGDGMLSGYIWTLYLLGFALLTGLSVVNQWQSFLMFLHAEPFGITDPVFGKDVAFYVFNLPVYQFLRTWYLSVMTIIFLGVLFSYVVDRAITMPGGKPHVYGKAATHLSLLGGLYLVGIAWTYRLRLFEILFSTRGVAFGASYTDMHALLPGYRIITVVMLVLALLVMLLPLLRRWKMIWIFGGIYLVVLASMIWLWPGVIQQYIVRPNELEKEEPYIANNIRFTRLAYGLDSIRELPFPADQTITWQDIRNNRNTIENIRLWDNRPLIQTYKQLQEIRLYYDFRDVDVDRYNFPRYTQVALAARELPSSQIPGRARTWVNIHLMYTHGYGVVMSPVNKVTPNGMPEFVIKNIPPQSELPIEIKRPQIYYGEETEDYAIVRTEMKEFDYPRGDQNVYNTYDGRGGVQLKGLFRRLVFAWNYSDIKILITGYITGESRIMYHRKIAERDRNIAPFLMYDSDPYLILGDDGRIYWMHDAYTSSDRYPYSEPVKPAGSSRPVNYIRNAVKVVTDAYDGTVTFYVIDEKDPLIRAYRKIYPTLFKPYTEMPTFLKAHIRYPSDLFTIQNSIYNVYHMTDPQVFYNQEDLWNVPTEIYQESEQRMRPYYVNMRIPQGDKEEFILMLPLTPSRKDNMVAWMCARCDVPHYGDLIVYQLPKEKLIYGPMQIEARINQKPDISSELTLWGQKGSRVIRGNLLIIPINHSFLYVEPVYLQSEQSQMPELKRVIVSFKDKTEMEPTLDEALRKVFLGAEAASYVEETLPPPEQEKGVSAPQKASDPASRALEHYNKAMDYLKKGDWAGYGREMDKMQKILEEMAKGAEGQKSPK